MAGKRARRGSLQIESLEDRTHFSTTLTWKTVATMPVPRAEGASFVADGKFYCFGGFSNATTLTISNEMDAYDPVANTWTRMADCPVKVNDNPVTVDTETDTAWCGGFFLNDGFHASKLMYEYHVKTNTWSQGPSLPLNVGSGQMGIVGRSLYYFGGRDASNTGTTATWKLDLDSSSASWVSDTPMLYTANHDGAVNLNNKIYAIGGIVNKEETTSNQNHVQVFDPTTDQWTLAAPMPIGLGHIASAVTVANGDIIVAGGQVDGSGQVMSNEVLQYDPSANSWTRLTNLPDYRVSSFLGYLNGELIVTGGNQYSQPYIDTTTWAASYGQSTTTLPTMTLANATAQEGSDEQFTVTLSSAATSVVTASYSVTAGTAAVGDFDQTGGTFTIPVGATRGVIDVPTYDDTADTSEQFTLTLGALSNAVFANDISSVSATGTITPAVVTPVLSTTTLSASSNAGLVNATINLSASVVTVATDPSVIPTGTVAFLDNGATIGTVALDGSGSAAFTTAGLSSGTHSFSARYIGDGTVAGSSSVPTIVTITPVAPTLVDSITLLTASSETLVAGQETSFAVSVESAGGVGIPTGTITLLQDGTTAGVASLVNGLTTFTVPATIAASAQSFTAVYSGDSEFAASNSTPVNRTVLPLSAVVPTIAGLTLPADAIAGQHFTSRLIAAIQNNGSAERGKFTLSVFADASASGLTSKAIKLTTTAKNFALKQGKSARLATGIKSLPDTLPSGVYHLVALITDPAGNSNIVTSASTVTVAAPDVSLTLTGLVVNPATVKSGGSATLQVSLTNAGNITARGILSVQIDSADSNQVPNGVALASIHHLTGLKAGAVLHLRVRFRIPRATVPGEFNLLASASLAGSSVEAFKTSAVTVI